MVFVSSVIAEQRVHQLDCEHAGFRPVSHEDSGAVHSEDLCGSVSTLISQV